MEAVYGASALLFLLAVIAYIWLTIRGLQAANVALRDRAVAAEQELAAVLETLSAPERQRVERERNRSRPMPHPPSGLMPTLTRLRHIPEHAGDPYAFAVGWEVTRGNPDIVSLSLASDSPYRSGNIAITGEPGHGKGTLGQSILLQLAHNTTTSQLRLQILDPKVSDGALWRGKAHLWRAPVLGEDKAEIRGLLDALRAERIRRDQLRADHRVREWEELPVEVRPPRLLVWITELSTIAKAIEHCDDWLEDELAKCRAAGITYLIDLQNQSGKEMAWRSQIGTFIAGFQSSNHHIRPNIGLSAEEIRDLGGMLPTELHRGQFTVRNKREVLTVAAPHYRMVDLEVALAALPDAPSAPVPAPTATPTLRPIPVDDISIAPELWARIADAAREIERTSPTPSRADVYRRVFTPDNPKSKPSGDNYTRVRMVCDAEGLLMPRAATPAPLEMVDTA